MRRQGWKSLLWGTVGALSVLLALGAYARGTRRYLVLNVGVSLPVVVLLCEPVSGPLQVGMLVQLTPPPRVVTELARIAPGLASHLPWIKRVRAVEGMTVCWEGGAVLVQDCIVATLPLLAAYPIVPRAGCLTLAPDEVFVLGSHPRSYDSRYFGPLSQEELTAVCAPLLPWEGEE